MTVQSVYDAVCRRLMEPGGASSGIFSEAQFLRLFGIKITEFMQRTGAWKRVYTQMIRMGIREYLMPDNLVGPEVALVNARLISLGSQEELDLLRTDWRRERDVPSMWYKDGLAIETVGLHPNPNYTGTAIPGPMPPFGTFDTFGVGDRNLTMMGTYIEVKAWTLADTIPYLPNSACVYLSWGVLQNLLSGNSELRDAQRALYASARWEEGINLFSAFARAVEGDNQ